MFPFVPIKCMQAGVNGSCRVSRELSRAQPRYERAGISGNVGDRLVIR
ncbi:MAG: hypothetical protein JWN94_2335 [Betaproteobacteria bacterium]|nr:hypothetical protein [Betaproteobacteria bacterium]